MTKLGFVTDPFFNSKYYRDIACHNPAVAQLHYLLFASGLVILIRLESVEEWFCSGASVL